MSSSMRSEGVLEICVFGKVRNSVMVEEGVGNGGAMFTYWRLVSLALAEQ